MKRILTIIGILFVVFILGSNVYGYVKDTIYKDILDNLEGELYYLKRVDGSLTLFKSDANLKNEKLLYSHKGKGEDGYGDYNDNIIDYFFDSEKNTLNFVAMHNGDWRLFTLTEGIGDANIGQSVDTKMSIKTDYIEMQSGNLKVFQKKYKKTS